GMMPPFGMPGPGGPGGFPRKSPAYLNINPSSTSNRSLLTPDITAPMPGRGMPFPPFPPNAQGGMPPLPGGMPFPPPGGMPPDFRFPPPQFGPPQGMGPGPGGPGGFGPPQEYGGDPRR
ncbi:hypothetical protein MMC30_008856, partial [Trapelia coarctata]|nr:hypothetical protein [Trapelia coarctata]